MWISFLEKMTMDLKVMWLPNEYKYICHCYLSVWPWTLRMLFRKWDQQTLNRRVSCAKWELYLKISHCIPPPPSFCFQASILQHDKWQKNKRSSHNFKLSVSVGDGKKDTNKPNWGDTLQRVVDSGLFHHAHCGLLGHKIFVCCFILKLEGRSCLKTSAFPLTHSYFTPVCCAWTWLLIAHNVFESLHEALLCWLISISHNHIKSHAPFWGGCLVKRSQFTPVFLDYTTMLSNYYYQELSQLHIIHILHRPPHTYMCSCVMPIPAVPQTRNLCSNTHS